MKRVRSFIGTLCCDVTHSTRFQMSLDFDPEKLAREIENRGRKSHDWGHRFSLERDTEGVQCYTVTVAKVEALDGFFEIAQEIECDVIRAREAQRLLNLVS